jgi:hypothetical protein
MKVIFGMLAGLLFLIALMAATAAAAIANALPLIITGVVIGLGLRALSGRPSPPAPPQPMPPAISGTTYPPGQTAGGPPPLLAPPTAASSGTWVFLPLWVAPPRRPSPPRIDTVFLREERHGRQW